MKKFIETLYPEAKEGKEITSICMDKLNSEHGFDNDRTILATSVCSDEIIRTATNFRDYVSDVSIFQLGGLSGFPFTGITGFKAFASHIPDDGFSIILYGPHIGISKGETLGNVVRRGQGLESSCCGALIGSLKSLEAESVQMPDKELDYQQWFISNTLKEKRKRIFDSKQPLVKATDEWFSEIDKRIKALLAETAPQFKNTKVALIGGVVINTDHDQPDWFDLREFEVHTF